MSRLFWKIFLWFLLAMGLVAITLVLTIVSTQSESLETRLRLFVSSWMPSQAGHVVSIYETQGPDALQKYLSEIAQAGPPHAILYRSDGTNVLGGHVPANFHSLIAQAAASQQTQFASERRTRIIAQGASGASGNRYVFFTEHPSPPLLPLPRGTPLEQTISVAAVVLVGALVCLWLAHYITSPVLRLQEAARKIADGQLDTRVRPLLGSRRDEIANLGSDFDLMAERIENLMSAQHRLLQAISHELRSPLARLSVALGLARQRTNGDLRPTLDRIERETGRLDAMITQLLTLSRLESGQHTPPKITIELSLLLQEIVSDADFEARSARRSVVTLFSEPFLVDANPALLRSALENVVRNAVRYTAENSQVEVSLLTDKHLDGSIAVISVTDSGPGVPEKDLENIFRPFFRVEDARERETGGTGLGLAITYHTMRFHGGTVHARKAPSGGLTVELRLPSRISAENLAPDLRSVNVSA